MVSAFRLPSLSLIHPEKSLEIDAVAPPTPSIRPTISALAPNVEVRKTGSKPWIISDETSINMLTKPSTQMPTGIRRDGIAVDAFPSLTQAPYGPFAPRQSWLILFSSWAQASLAASLPGVRFRQQPRPAQRAA